MRLLAARIGWSGPARRALNVSAVPFSFEPKRGRVISIRGEPPCTATGARRARPARCRLVRFIYCVFSEIVLISSRPASCRGTYASSRNVEVGCDGRDGCARRAWPARTAKSCGPGLSTLRSSPWSLLDGARGRWGQKSPIPRESTKDTVKTIAQGRPECTGRACGSCPVHFLTHGGHGCGQHPVFPAPSVFIGGTCIVATRARCAARLLSHVPGCLRCEAVFLHRRLGQAVTRAARHGADPGPIRRGGRGLAMSHDRPAPHCSLWLWIPAFAGMTAVDLVRAHHLTGVIASEAKQSRNASAETVWIASAQGRLAMTVDGVRPPNPRCRPGERRDP